MEDRAKTNRIGQDFTFSSLIRYLVPTMITQIFISLFKTVDDGLFVTNYVGTNALSAINILFPYMLITDAFAFLFATGGNAVCSRRMGEGRQEEAKASFTSVAIMIVCVTSVISAFSLAFQDPILRILGATDILMEDARIYSTYMWAVNPVTLLGLLFDFFYSTSGRPSMSIICTVINGIVNIIFDILFIVVLKLGVRGAALASQIGNILFTFIGLVFYMNKAHEIHFTKPFPHWWKLFKDIVSVGMAQFFNQAAVALSSYIADVVILGIAGEDGLAAYSIVGYLQWLVGSGMGGFADGVSSIFSYNYGAANRERIHRYFWYCIRFLVFAAAAIVAFTLLFSKPLISIYVQEDTDKYIFDMVFRGLRIACFASLFSGFGMFSARFFTAMNNGRLSAFISFMRNGVFIGAASFILPALFGIDGIWMSMPVSEAVSAVLIAVILYLNRNNYALSKDMVAFMINDSR